MTLVRQMTEADLDAVSHLAEKLVKLHHHWDATRFFITKDIAKGYRWYFGTLLQDEKSVLLVSENDGAVSGYLYGLIEERDWSLLLDEHGTVCDIFVAEKYRRQGVARALMAAAKEALGKKGAKQLILYSASANEQGQALFRSIGYRPTMVEMTMDLTAPEGGSSR